jgi:exodeoxyribonuclease VIII
MNEFIKSGVIQPTTAEYYSRNAISASGLKRLKVSPAHYRFGEPMKETDAIRFGRAYHCFVLQPGEFAREYYVMDDVEIYSELVAKGFKSPRSTKEYKEWAAAEGAKAGTRTTIDGEQYQKMTDMVKSLTSYPFAKKLISGGEAEIGYEGTIETIAGPINVKLKPDYVNKDKAVIVDLKTAADSSAAGFARAAASYDYHIQAAFYKDMMDLKDTTAYSFFFIAQETEPPYAVNVFEASDQFIGQGRYEVELLLSLYKYCTDNNKWPSYEVFNQNKYGVQQLDLPAYAIKPLDYFIH